MISDNLLSINKELPSDVRLVAVSKFHPLESILEAYEAGQRLFAESRPQELEKKIKSLRTLGSSGRESSDIEFHFIGHLQTNKLKLVLPYVSMVQSVDSRHLLEEIDKWGRGCGKVTDILLEIHVAAEETKSGLYEEEILDILWDAQKYRYVRFRGLMGMATNTDDVETIKADFARISQCFDYYRDLFADELPDFDQLSIGMSSDWRIALDYHPTMVRIGTAIFGERQ